MGQTLPINLNLGTALSGIDLHGDTLLLTESAGYFHNLEREVPKTRNVDSELKAVSYITYHTDYTKALDKL